MSAQVCGCDREEHHLCERHEDQIRQVLKDSWRTRVILESPLGAPTRAGIERNKRYARAAMRDSLLRGEAPFASHLLYDHLEILDDQIDLERELGMTAGFQWFTAAHMSVAYTDLGISNGMNRGLQIARNYNLRIELRELGPGWDK